MKNLKIKDTTIRFVAFMALCFCAGIIDTILYGTLVNPMYQDELGALLVNDALIMLIGLTVVGILRKEKII